MDRVDRNKKENFIKLYLNDKEKLKLDKIVKELHQAKSIDTEDISEFLKFTISIIFYEYEKNKNSLDEFYRHNKEVYKQDNNEV